MARRLHDHPDALHAVRLARPAEHNVAELLLGAQLIVARLRQHLRGQVDHHVGAVALAAALHVQLGARALVVLVVRLEEVPLAGLQPVLALQQQLARQQRQLHGDGGVQLLLHQAGQLEGARAVGVAVYEALDVQAGEEVAAELAQAIGRDHWVRGVDADLE